MFCTADIDLPCCSQHFTNILHHLEIVMCRLGSAWKPRLRLGIFRPGLLKNEAWAVPVGPGRLRLGLGLGRGLCWQNCTISGANYQRCSYFCFE